MMVLDPGTRIFCYCGTAVLKMTQHVFSGMALSLDDVERVDGAKTEAGKELSCQSCGRTLTMGDLDRAGRKATASDLPFDAEPL